MKSTITASLFAAVPEATRKMGQYIRSARQARGWTMAETAERCLMSLSTYKRIEVGDPSVASGFWLQTLFQLGLMKQLVQSVSPEADQLGETLRHEQARQRIRKSANRENEYDF